MYRIRILLHGYDSRFLLIVFGVFAWLATTTILPLVVHGQHILSTLGTYESLRDHALEIQRIQNVHVAIVPSTSHAEDSSRTNSTIVIPFVHLAMIMPFSGHNTKKMRVPLDNGVFQGMAAVLLAAEHLNNGNGSIVTEVTNLHQRCPLRFTTEILDSAHSATEAADQVLTILARPPEQWPTAFIGAQRSAVSMPTSMITGLQNFPQISPQSTSKQLDDKSLYPLFGRTVPSDDGTAIPAIQYLRYTLGVKHLAVLHVSDAYGNDYALGLKLAAAQYAPDMEVTSFDFPFDITDEIVEHTISLIKQGQFRYIFGIIFSSVHYEPFLTEAYKQQIAGTGLHNWMFADGVDTSYFTNLFIRGSPLHLATRGTSRIAAVGGVPGIEIYDRFLHAIRSLNNPLDIPYIQGKHPRYPNEPNYKPLNITDDPYFFDKTSDETVAFLYDAAIALGLAACNSLPTTENEYFDGETLYATFKNTTFNGVTGTNLYNPATGSRITSSARFVLQNTVESLEESDETTIRFSIVETDIYINGQWEEREEMIFNDGTTVPPDDLPYAAVDYNYIGTGLRAGILVMTGLIYSLSLGFVGWTYHHRDSHVVKASQPFFLYVIAAGCFLMGSTILFLSIDDEIASPHVCTVSCTLVPWCFAVGWVVAFSALFTKINRVYKIIEEGKSMKRIKVTVSDVMKPLLFFLSASILILLLWSFIAPPKWKRYASAMDNFERPIESIGSCTFTDGGIPYFSSLAVIMFGVLAFSVYEAYRARHISTEFAESDYIFLVLIATLLVSFMGIPVMVIAGGSGNPREFFFATSGIIFVVCTAMLILIFVPKVVSYNKRRKKQKRSTIHVSGIGSGGDYLPSNYSGADYSQRTDFHPDMNTLSLRSQHEGSMLTVQTSKRAEELMEELCMLKSKNKSLRAQLRKSANEEEELKENETNEEEKEEPENAVDFKTLSGDDGSVSVSIFQCDHAD